MDDQYYRKSRSAHPVLALLGSIFKRKSVRWGLALGIPVLLFITLGNKGLLQHIRLEGQKSEMEVKIRLVQEEQRRLQNQSSALESDPRAIEKIAREKYGMIRDGETIYKVKKEK